MTDSTSDVHGGSTIGRASALLASGTFVSRILGFISALVLARTIGIVGAGADTFVFANVDIKAEAPPPVTHVMDYSFAAGDKFDFSALTSQFHATGVNDALIVRAVEDGSGTFATLQVDKIDPHGMPAAPIWVNVAEIAGAHSGDTLNLLVDSHSAVHVALIHVDVLV